MYYRRPERSCCWGFDAYGTFRDGIFSTDIASFIEQAYKVIGAKLESQVSPSNVFVTACAMGLYIPHSLKLNITSDHPTCELEALGHHQQDVLNPKPKHV